jgi:Fe-S cluster biogenesis protein NfuA|tara:strand:+ start:201 stop:467 length:267 start_codon:yes stop_codon:yes gene_type:complete
VTVFAKIEDALADQVAPAIAMHGGQIQLLSYDADTKNVHVKLSGSCAGCAASVFTLKLGVEDMLVNEFPDDVHSVSHEEGEITTPYYS